MPAQKPFLATAVEASKVIKRLPAVCYRVIDGSEMFMIILKGVLYAR